jgi:putative transposase
MTALESADGAAVLRQLLAEGQPDVLRTMVAAFANALMSAEADGLCGAEYGQRSDERTS